MCLIPRPLTSAARHSELAIYRYGYIFLAARHHVAVNGLEPPLHRLDVSLRYAGQGHALHLGTVRYKCLNQTPAGRRQRQSNSALVL